MRLEYCCCGHLPTQHAITAGAAGLGVHACEASTASRRICGCRGYAPQFTHSADLEVDEELPWRAA